MLDAVVWGLVQGLTEFLPISSSGHLVLVPAFLAEAGIDLGDPDLATSAVLHLGTLIAVVAYYHRDLWSLLRRPTAPQNRHVILLLAVGTIPAVIGLPLQGTLERIEETPRWVAAALIATGLILLLGTRIVTAERRVEDLRARDAVGIGAAQALALIPGISRSGSTITAGLGLGLDREEAARFSFLLAIPAIAGGGLISLLDLDGSSVGSGALAVGFLVAAVSGYAAISALISVLVRRGLGPFVGYCVVVGVAGVVLL